MMSTVNNPRVAQRSIAGLTNLRDALDQQAYFEADAVQSAFDQDNLVIVNEADTGKEVVMRAAEKYHSIQRQVFTSSTLTQTATTPTSFASANQSVTFILKKDLGIGYVKDAKLKIQLKETSGSGTITPLNVWMLFTSFEIWVNTGRDKLQTLYPEKMFQYFLSYFNGIQKKNIDDWLNVSAPTYQNETTLLQNQAATYYIPLFGNWIETSGGIDLSQIDNEIWIVCYLRQNPIKASNGGSLGLNGISLMLDELYVPTKEDSDIHAMYAGRILEKNYLDTYRWTLNTAAEALSNSVQYVRQLVPFRGKSPQLFMLVRTPSNATTLTGNAYLKTIDLGSHVNGFAVDITNLNGQSLVGNNPYWLDLSRSYNAAKAIPGVFPQMFKNWYWFQWSDTFAAEDVAMRKGWFTFTGDEMIKVTPGQAGAETAEVCTITPGAALTGGQIGFVVNGHTIPFTYPYTSTGTTIAGDINKFCLFDSVGWDGTPIICTGSSGHLDSGTSGFTLTFSNLPATGFSSAGKGVQVTGTGLTVASGSAAITVSVTTAGVPHTGADTLASTAVQLDFFLSTFRHAHIDHGHVVVYTSEPYDGQGAK